ncbi:hypothetical protein LPJ78_005705 [Coemansia sp. RSA 989]|nr:hypothetical protein LPJ78_005705 [Coemansia sp. RSA 989]
MCAYRATTFEERGIYPPPKESVTVGEADLKFIHLRDGNDPGLLQYVRNGGIAFPHIMVPDTLQLRSVSQPHSDVNALPNAASVLRRSSGDQAETSANTKEGGLQSTLSTMISHATWLWNAKQNIGEAIDNIKTQSLLAVESRLPGPLSQVIFSHVSGTASAAKADALKIEEAEGYRSMLAKTEGPISCVAWHPHRSLIAIAHHAADCIFIYDLANDTWCANVLQNAYMKGISCMAWQPNCGYTLAVGCITGVCLWNIVPPSSAAETADVQKAPGLGSGQFSAWMTMLSFPPLSGAHQYPSQLSASNHPAFHHTASSVSAITFSRNGQWLITGHQAHGHLTVWDVALGTATPLKRSGSTSRSATLQLGISPDDRYLVTTHANGQLRLWETENWASQVWSDFKTNVVQFAWSPDSKAVYFACEGGHDIYALVLYKMAPSLDADVTVVTSFEPHAATVTDEDGDSKRIHVGGAIKSLAVDPRGQRLVVSFDDDSTSGDISLLAVYLVDTEALFRAGGDSNALMPLGYIRGPNWGKQPQVERQPSDPTHKAEKAAKNRRVRVGTPIPSWFGFAPNFESGSLLTVAWANGKISFIPSLFASRISKQ